MVEAAIRLMEQADWFEAISYLNSNQEKLEVLDSYNELIKHLYYDKKNVPAVIAMARSGINHGLAVAGTKEGDDPDLAWQLKNRARSLSYNLASYTWPGWDDPGISIGSDSLAQGMDAARVTLRLTYELKLGPLKQSRSTWLLGAHMLAAGELLEAITYFDEAARLAKKADSEADVLLNQGYTTVARLLLTRENKTLESQFSMIKDQLSGVADGDFLIDQLETALRVFATKPS